VSLPTGLPGAQLAQQRERGRQRRQLAKHDGCWAVLSQRPNELPWSLRGMRPVAVEAQLVGQVGEQALIVDTDEDGLVRTCGFLRLGPARGRGFDRPDRTPACDDPAAAPPAGLAIT
jgi:hypothetical protein